MWLECTPENWITVDITKCSRKTIPHNRTANRKCTLPELSSCASYSGGSGSQRSEVTYLWLCRVNCYHAGQRDRKDNIFGQFDVRNVSEMTKSLHRHYTGDSGKEWLKRWVFKWFLKTDIDDADVIIIIIIIIQRLMAAGTEKARSVDRRWLKAGVYLATPYGEDQSTPEKNLHHPWKYSVISTPPER